VTLETLQPGLSFLRGKFFWVRKEENIIGSRARRERQDHQGHVGKCEVDRACWEDLLGKIFACHHDENILKVRA
jgi:hypothetical protein